MQLKRQRSDSEVSIARTQKRYRDNRPDEDTIHRTIPVPANQSPALTQPENTLSLLFSAQQAQPQAQPQSPSPPINLPRRAFQNLANVSLPATQTSLHSFWALPKARSVSNDFGSAASTSSPALSTTPLHAPFFQATNCEDCDALLSSDHDAMDVDMDIDIMTAGGGVENWGCATCGKQVCRNCAVSNLGDMRCCLGCAGRTMGHGGKKWEGGRLGWIAA